MAIVKHNPFRELRTMQDQMNRMLDMAWNREFVEDLKEGVWQPAVDIYEDEHSVIIKAEVPDVEQKDIEVRIVNGTLTLRGERKPSSDIRKENYYRIERYFGQFQRSFSLPQTIDQDKVQAACDKGILTITLPKREETRPIPISVEVK
jgi:HSP20 family protein